MVVFSSIHSRLHSSMSRAFKILHRINSAYLTEEDIAAEMGGVKVKPSDFDGPMDIIPVSDPAIFSETQRFAQTQAIMQRAAMMPQMYDQRKVEEMFLRSMKIKESEVMQPQPGKDDIDPVSENVAAAMGRPVYVLPMQDHMAHIQTHMAFLQSPLFGQNPAIMKTYMYPIATHLRDHLLNYYLTETHEAVDQGHKQGVIEDDASQQVQMILQVQKLIEQQLGSFGPMLAQIDQAAQQFKPQPPMPPDSSLQVAQLGAQVQQAALAQRAQAEEKKLQQTGQIKQAELMDKQASRQEELQREQLRQENENQRTILETQTRREMNTADNETAMHLAAAEIATGENFAVSTGTGINPGTR
jgi:hypothetical protein